MAAAMIPPTPTTQGVAQPNCVTIATPSPAKVYAFQHSESTGTVTQRTEQWERVDAMGSRVRVTGPAGAEVQVNDHHVVDDVAMLTKQSKLSAGGAVVSSTTFAPALASDPAFRACAGKSWTIPQTTATHQPGSRQAVTPAGALTIVAIREKVTVPAGTFETVHYKRTSLSVDEYWKSTADGVIVKHIATLPNFTMTDVLQSIR
jgi:hypothetical protein